MHRATTRPGRTAGHEAEGGNETNIKLGAWQTANGLVCATTRTVVTTTGVVYGAKRTVWEPTPGGSARETLSVTTVASHLF